MTTKIHLVTVHHHTMLVQYHGRYSLVCMLHPHNICSTSGFSTSQSLSPFALTPLPLSPLSTTSMFLGIYESISVMCLFYFLVSTRK